jgi:hypothetical protein
MLTTLLCWFFGHKFVDKVYAGVVVKYYLGEAYNCNSYKWKPMPFCSRCGKPNKNYEETK